MVGCLVVGEEVGCLVVGALEGEAVGEAVGEKVSMFSVGAAVVGAPVVGDMVVVVGAVVLTVGAAVWHARQASRRIAPPYLQLKSAVAFTSGTFFIQAHTPSWE